MSSEYRKPSPGPQDPEANNPHPRSELWGGRWELGEEDTQPYHAISNPQPPPTRPAPTGEHQGPSPQQVINPQISYREHVTGALPAYPSDAPLFRPAYMPYPPSQQGPGAPPSQQAPGYPPAGQSYLPQMPQGPAYSPSLPQGYVPPGQGSPAWAIGNPPYPMPGYPPPGVPPHQRSAAWGTAHLGYPSYQGYTSVPYAVYPGYNGYVPYYAWQQPQPKRDGFHLAVSIISLSGSILAILGGLASILFLALFLLGTSVNSRVISGDQYFSSLLTFTAFALAGTAGGGFSLYHSIRALLRKPSAKFALPWFWIFIILYLFVVAIGYALLANGKEVASLPLAVVLIILAAIFPAIALAAFGVRRLRFPTWTTTWRRFTLALTSGATLAIGLALILELGFLLLLVRTQGTVDLNFQKCIDNPDQPGCGSFTTFNLIFIVVAIIGPLVEETVKPLAVAFFIGRMRSASEAFILGMAAGIGFAMVETVGYIGAGYQDWLSVALERTGASLLHGFGAAMVALGWYYLIRPSEKRHLLKAFGCWAYAVFQHFVWNGTAVLSYMPGPVGRTLNNWNLNLGFVTLPFVEILNIIEAALILGFFIYMTGRLRRNTPPPSSLEDRKVESLREPSWHPQGVPLQ